MQTNKADFDGEAPTGENGTATNKVSGASEAVTNKVNDAPDDTDVAAVIKVKDNRALARYEEALLRRDNLRKEAEQIHIDFIREFGDLMTESFRMKVECIRKKKMISYCQKLMNLGKDINGNDLTRYIEKEMAEYEAELAEMIQGVTAAKHAEAISDADVRKVKKIYYALVKLIHPDMHPELADDSTIREYWGRIVTAYRHNDLDEMQELDTLVRMYLSGHGIDPSDVNVEDIEDKIAKVENEIETILTTNPYLYRLILENKKEIEAKKREYEEEIASYKKYSEELDEVLSEFEIKEMLS